MATFKKFEDIEAWKKARFLQNEFISFLSQANLGVITH